MPSAPDNPSRRHFFALSLALPFLPLTPSFALAHIARRSSGEVPLPFASGQNTFTSSFLWDAALDFTRQNGNLTAYEQALRHGPRNAFLNNPQRFARQIALAESAILSAQLSKAMNVSGKPAVCEECLEKAARQAVALKVRE
jgi:hypothetical protein